MSPLMIVFWLAAVLVPVAACIVSISVLPDAAQIPLHWNAAGEIDRWGDPAEHVVVSWFMAAVLGGVNLLLALCYVFNDVLYARGMVHGVSRSGARKVYVVLAAVDALIAVGFFAWVTSAIIAAL
ncbi:MAG: DUF1648 domain-containing protein [Eggerthellaceae bacterium]|nr:DUF1648 domain-containing protein [Eggerthellaceae bacterium]